MLDLKYMILGFDFYEILVDLCKINEYGIYDSENLVCLGKDLYM